MSNSNMPLLTVIPNVAAADEGEQIFLDVKACEGLQLYARYWPGRLRCISRAGDPKENPYGRWYRREELPFEHVSLATDAPIDHAVPHLQESTLVLAGADDYRVLGLPELVSDTPVVMTIENTLRTRIDLVRLGTARLDRKLRSIAWLLRNEGTVRRALARSAGLQANGTPAFDAYAPLNPRPMRYFDTRLAEADCISDDDIIARATPKPLRIAFSGRLERIKGAHYLIPLMQALVARGCDATLDVYGDGTLLPKMRRLIADRKLGAHVALHGSLDFDTQLVPALQREADLFVCLHPQGDPSCTYLETLGCGLPIVGFLNQAFRGVLGLGECGVGVPTGDIAQAAAAICALDRDRPRLVKMARSAGGIGRAHSFERTFARRVEHLCTIAGL